MAITIVTRAGKGAALNATEFDANVANLAAAIENLTTGHDHDGGDSKQIGAANIVNTPAGDIAAITVQAALNELDTEKVPKDSFVRNTSAFAGPAGVTITHNFGTTNYHVIIEPTVSPGGLLGEVSYTKSANTVVVYNSGAAVTAFAYLLIKY